MITRMFAFQTLKKVQMGFVWLCSLVHQLYSPANKFESMLWNLLY